MIRIKKLFLLILTVCFAVALSCGIAACGEDGGVLYIPVTGIGLDQNELELEVDGTYILNVSVMPGNATDKTQTWQSSNPAVASVDGNGMITAKSVGEAVITVFVDEKEASCTVTVKEKTQKDIPVISVTLNKTSLSLELEESFKLIATVAPSNATEKTVTWKSSDTDVATVSDGTVTAKKAGSATITATAGGKSAECNVTVKEKSEGKDPDTTVPVSSVSLNKTSLELTVGDTYSELVATVLPENATDKSITWTSSSAHVTVSDKGVLTAVSAGEAVITAKAGDKSAECKVTVKEKSEDKDPDTTVSVSSVSLNKTSLELTVGDTYSELVATVLPENATDKSVTWTSSSAHVTVSDKGVLTAVSAGEAVITAKAGDKSAECKVTVKNPPPVAVTEVILDQTSLELVISLTYQLSAKVLPENAADKTVMWESSDEAVATVVGGLVTAVSKGTAIITATAGDISATCEVKVKDVPIVEVESVALNKSSLDLDEGQTFTLEATISPSNATDQNVKWTSSNDAVATVVGGLVTAVSAGEATITAEVGGKSASCTVNVKAVRIEVESVTLNKSSLDLDEGQTFTLEATISPSNATDKDVEWKSSNNGVATVVGGLVTAVSAGEATITAEVGGKSASCTVTVTAKRIEVISVTLNKTELELKVDETFKLIATINPSNATDNEIIWTSSDKNIASVGDDGTVTAKAVGTVKITATVGGKSAECVVGVIAKDSGTTDPDNPTPPNPPEESIITYAHAGEESAAFEWKDTDYSKAKVEYKLSSTSVYTAIDKQLIRKRSDTLVRADIVGLKGGVKYDFKITAGNGTVEEVKGVDIASLDRSGYGHTGKTDANDGVGAYKNDGTLKDNAVVIYLTEANKNNVDGKDNSIAEYLKNAKNNSDPIVVRVLGTVGSATWNKLEYNGGKPITKDMVVGVDGKAFPTSDSDLTQAALIKAGYNSLNYYPEKLGGVKCDPIDGLSSKAINGSKEYDSCWNDCLVEQLKNVTVEGIGDDAEIFQWGFTFKKCNSIEVRNIRFWDYTEDACSFEGSGSPVELSDFTYKNFWVHHNIFDIGMNYWDLCNEQDKHDGDGATDFKRLAYATIAYNRYNGTHKTGIVGSGDDVYQAAFTFHHNYYNGCDQRMPLGRQANMHMYNNFYSSSGKYSISLRGGAYAFVENCVFTSGKTGSSATRPIELLKGDTKNGTPSVKVIDCEMEGSIANEITGVKNVYVGDDRTETVEGSNKYGLNFDLDLPYTIADGTKLATSEIEETIPKIAGTQKRTNNIENVGIPDEEEPEVKPDPPVTDAKNVEFTVTKAVEAKLLEINSSSHEIGTVTLDEGIVLSITNATGKVDAKNRTIGGKTFGHRIVMKNKGNYFAVTTKAACTIKVYVINESSTDTEGREVGLYTDTAGTTLVSGTATTKIIGGIENAKVVEYSVKAAGVYYIESITNELSFYGIDVIYS